jgi:putative SOS response-associated peptidase YedK
VLNSQPNASDIEAGELRSRLDPKNEDTEALTKLLAPYPEKEMAAHPVSTLVNNPKFDDPRCIEPVK